MAELLDNARRRRELLESLARRLAGGGLPSEEIKVLLPSLEACGPEAVVDAVDALVASGMDLEEMKTAVSRLLNLLHRSLSATSFEPLDPFFSLLLLENRAAVSILDRLRPPLAAFLSAESSEARLASGPVLADGLKELAGLELHYRRKENILFPYFEDRHPRYRCLSLMWSIHDDVRRALRDLPLILEAEALDLPLIKALSGRLFFDIHNIVFREEKILYPVLAPLLSAEELGRLYREARALGQGLLSEADCAYLDEAARLWQAAHPSGREAAGLPSHSASIHQAESSGSAAIPGSASAEIRLAEGSLSPLLLDLILKSLPLDVTFVDAQDRVRYFSAGEERIFPRSASIIGREVKNCHPASSLSKVLAILDAFKSGEREREAFWIDMGSRFIHIEYRAIRGPSGEYLGTLEISQDLTEKRALMGEKRLASF